MTELKIRKFGNSLGVVLPREVIARLGVGEGEQLFLTETPDGGFKVSPFDPEFKKKMETAENLMSRYRDTLHVLAQ